MDAGLDDRARESKVDASRPSPALTPATTIEAMLYVLRRGLACLDDSSNRDRLRLCDDVAMKEIVSRLRSWKAQNVNWLPAWSDDHITKLAKAWRTLREGKA